MAKAKSKDAPSYPQHAVTPPGGGRVIPSVQGQFWNAEPGDVLEGALTGTQMIKNKDNVLVMRFALTKDESGGVVILPDHYDLTQKLSALVQAHVGEVPTGAGSLPSLPVWINFVGFEYAPNVRGKKLARYQVVDTATDQGS